MVKSEKYRMVTPSMDVIVGFQSRKYAIEEAEERAEKHPIKLYSRKLDENWLLIFDSEKGGEL